MLISSSSSSLLLSLTQRKHILVHRFFHVWKNSVKTHAMSFQDVRPGRLSPKTHLFLCFINTIYFEATQPQCSETHHIHACFDNSGTQEAASQWRQAGRGLDFSRGVVWKKPSAMCNHATGTVGVVLRTTAMNHYHCLKHNTNQGLLFSRVRNHCKNPKHSSSTLGEENSIWKSDGTYSWGCYHFHIAFLHVGFFWPRLALAYWFW